MYAATVRAGLPTEFRRALLPHFEKFQIPHCPFWNLPDRTEGRWGEGLTAGKMSACRCLDPFLVARIEFLEWTPENRPSAGLRSRNRGLDFPPVPVWLQPGPHAQRRYLVAENHQRRHGNQELQVLTSSTEFQLLGAPPARASEGCGYFTTGNCTNRGRNSRAPRCRRCNKYRTATSLIGDAQ